MNKKLLLCLLSANALCAMEGASDAIEKRKALSESSELAIAEFKPENVLNVVDTLWGSETANREQNLVILSNLLEGCKDEAGRKALREALNKSRVSPLANAMLSLQDVQLFRVLLQHGADYDRKTTGGKTIFEKAVELADAGQPGYRDAIVRQKYDDIVQDAVRKVANGTNPNDLAGQLRLEIHKIVTAQIAGEHGEQAQEEQDDGAGQLVPYQEEAEEVREAREALEKEVQAALGEALRRAAQQAGFKKEALERLVDAFGGKTVPVLQAPAMSPNGVDEKPHGIWQDKRTRRYLELGAAGLAGGLLFWFVSAIGSSSQSATDLN